MREDQRVRLSKQLLRNALILLLEEKSIHKISVREICEVADINRTTFYKYYKNQYELLEDIENILVDELAEKIAARGEKHLLHILETINDNAKIYRLFMNNMTDPNFIQRVFDLSIIHKEIAEATESISEEYSEYAYEFLTWGGYSVVRRWLNKEKRESPEEITEYINRLLANTIIDGK